MDDREEVMETFECLVCGYIYNPEEGDPAGGIPPGVIFFSLPDDWLCPSCGAGKNEFALVELWPLAREKRYGTSNRSGRAIWIDHVSRVHSIECHIKAGSGSPDGLIRDVTTRIPTVLHPTNPGRREIPGGIRRGKPGALTMTWQYVRYPCRSTGQFWYSTDFRAVIWRLFLKTK